MKFSEKMFFPISTYNGSKHMTMFACSALATETLKDNANARMRPATNAFQFEKATTRCTLGTVRPFSDSLDDLFKEARQEILDHDEAGIYTTVCTPKGNPN